MSSSMENLTTEEKANLADMQLNSLEVLKTPVSAWDVAIKSYVDGKVATAAADAATAVTNLLDGAPQQLNTLRELATALMNDANLGSALTTQIASVQSAVTSEAASRSASDATQAQASADEKTLRDVYRSEDQASVVSQVASEASARASDVEGIQATASSLDASVTMRFADESKSRSDGDNVLSASLASEVALLAGRRLQDQGEYRDAMTAEVASREQKDSELIQSVVTEHTRASNAEDSLEGKVSAEVSERQSADTFLNEQIQGLQQSKFNVSPYYSGDGESPFKITEASYLYIGNCWRIYANNAGGKKRLEFQYSADGSDEGFKVAVPFIRA